MSRKKVIQKKKRGRPATGQDPLAALRLPTELLREIDNWRRAQPGLPSRSAAIRYLVECGLKSLVIRHARSSSSWTD